MDNKLKVKKIIELARFRFLAGGFFLYTMGAFLAVASGIDFSIELFIFGYAIMMPAHLALSYSNNYFDIEVDKKNTPVSISGGSKVLIDYPELISMCKYISIILMLLSVFLATIFVLLFSYSLVFIAFIVFGNLLGFFYTSPPLKLAYRGFGEVANMINMGLLMPGIGYWAMKGNLDLFYFVFAAAFFLYGLEFMIIVETPDMEGDIKAKKMTFVASKGRRFSYIILLCSIITASLYFLAVGLVGIFADKINYFIIFLLSLFPIIIAVKGFLKNPIKREIATKIAEKNMYTLITFVILINIYLIFRNVLV